ncbi:MAG: nitrite reductase small subunit NirD [Betaproteobacteria bacterium]|uniref:nitrite reductase small subunit NirD n=1 Tax=Thiomonas sp. FB-6 TaxID=1158291 RepID=UPI000374A542|nr:nitrite reductase small subunit NirD [Thiomonas sp. FB-6]MBU6440432.1 nitrite reductase small subunit NirD [Betaproteobacteria bacterium]MBU6510939.1 nitrite reductase small subunit NirD [Betaproteobacteria bacterium]MDE1954432.1 nitrite reductase small subunit NirD [Betaproteobacteria bacterium]MDE2151350.1 nitrite reductase small subunit NirD [Betaproteobacteria bacterium]
MDAWTEICRVDELPRLGARTLRRPHGGDIAVFRTEGDEVFALLDRCPHKGGPLSQGLVFGRAVACPLHNWTVALDSGCAVAPDHGCTPAFEVRVEQGRVYLRAQALAGGAGTLPEAAGSSGDV